MDCFVMHQIALSDLIKVESGGTGQAVGQGGLRGSHAAEGRAKRDAKRNNQEIIGRCPISCFSRMFLLAFLEALPWAHECDLEETPNTPNLVPLKTLQTKNRSE